MNPPTTTISLFVLRESTNGAMNGVLHLCIADSSTGKKASGAFSILGTANGPTANVVISTSSTTADNATLVAANGGVDFSIHETTGTSMGHAAPATLADYQQACTAIGIPGAK